jgi:pimeloyl-ACP methyl ester carboxylesterase
LKGLTPPFFNATALSYGLKNIFYWPTREFLTMVAAAINAASPQTNGNSSEGSQELRRPPLALTLLEGRGVLEWAATYAARDILSSAPQGDDHPVILLPGFLASDRSTAPLRKFLTHLGYDARGWGQGQNLGRFYKMRTILEAYVDDVYAQTGQKISLIGWSLGGVFARHLALVRPDKIRSVISLASPFAADIHANSARKLYEMLSKEGPAQSEDLERLAGDLPVPNSSIYSKLDGVVNWRTSIAKSADNSENIEIRLASHVGIGINPASFWAIADRLAQPEGVFTPFAKNGPFALAYG